MTPDRVYSDLLSVADAAGFDRFAYCGHLWGAVNGLMLASRSDRVTGLVCGTWPPLGAPYADMLRGVEMQLAEPPSHAMVILRDPLSMRSGTPSIAGCRGGTRRRPWRRSPVRVWR